MGLDNFAVLPQQTNNLWTNAPDEKFKGIQLCGGIHSGGDSSASFRGKVYRKNILQATGVDIQTKYLSPSELEELLIKMSNTRLDAWGDGITLNEIANLKRFIQVCITHGYGLAGWW